jgi:hypothetical protein
MRPGGAGNRKPPPSGGARALLLELVRPAQKPRHRRKLAFAQLGGAGGVGRFQDDLDRYVVCLSSPA